MSTMAPIKRSLISKWLIVEHKVLLLMVHCRVRTTDETSVLQYATSTVHTKLKEDKVRILTELDGSPRSICVPTLHRLLQTAGHN